MPPTKWTEKDLALRVIQDQPDDCTLEELARELLFHDMVLRGAQDCDAGRVITHEQMKREVESWFRSSGQPKPSAASGASTTTSPKTTRKRRSA